ncbi:aminotransferase class V-fold PLP-dependent enzyme [Brachyspira alvinipulli]|uniref:aminotransferase class V-fold PLP-dependent enzyme n=1 Tax=Brachyspira alvinipulli TaxID=84379 RepID=UPI0004863294|nr:aminotransferase class V-fold PLP-dependent enzyme [Brachyspira alvinipulli]
MLNKKLIEEEFSFLNGVIFLNVASVVMPPKRVQESYKSYMEEYVQNFGINLVSKSWNIVNETREKISKLINSKYSHEIAFVKNTCEGMSILASRYPLKKGDNVIIADQEHQSALFPWINMHEQKGIVLKVIKNKNGEVDYKEMANAIDNNTKILIVSSIQFSTGFLSDLYFLGEECKKKGVIFAVDGIQSVGRMNIDVQKMNIDYLTCGTNKGLLGTLGAGFVYCSDNIVEKIIPYCAGYQSTINHISPPSITDNFEYIEWYPHARRFEAGNLNYNCILAISKGIDLILELGIDEIEYHIRKLERRLRESLKNIPLTVVQAKNEKNWGGIVCIYYPNNQEEKVQEILSKYKIYCTMRAGYIRLSINFYNTEEQMDIAAKAIDEISKI